jgi:DNA modification methylase
LSEKKIPRKRRLPASRANDLDGSTWGRYSISLWSDIRKTPEEISLRHPALLPMALASRLIESFTRKQNRVVLDPFAGVGSVPLAAGLLAGKGIGIELSLPYLEIARSRAKNLQLEETVEFFHGDARELTALAPPESVDLIITSPPYWDILLQKRSADRKSQRDYGETGADLGKITDYRQFLSALKGIFTEALALLRPGAYCCIVVMDLRKRDKFYPLHSDLAEQLQQIGFIFDDLIIWDRRQEYNHLRPLGYPSVFRINKTHEFIVIFRKPKC